MMMMRTMRSDSRPEEGHPKHMPMAVSRGMDWCAVDIEHTTSEELLSSHVVHICSALKQSPHCQGHQRTSSTRAASSCI